MKSVRVDTLDANRAILPRPRLRSRVCARSRRPVKQRGRKRGRRSWRKFAAKGREPASSPKETRGGANARSDAENKVDSPLCLDNIIIERSLERGGEGEGGGRASEWMRARRGALGPRHPPRLGLRERAPRGKSRRIGESNGRISTVLGAKCKTPVGERGDDARRCSPNESRDAWRPRWRSGVLLRLAFPFQRPLPLLLPLLPLPYVSLLFHSFCFFCFSRRS